MWLWKSAVSFLLHSTLIFFIAFNSHLFYCIQLSFFIAFNCNPSGCYGVANGNVPSPMQHFSSCSDDYRAKLNMCKSLYRCEVTTKIQLQREGCKGSNFKKTKKTGNKMIMLDRIDSFSALQLLPLPTQPSLRFSERRTRTSTAGRGCSDPSAGPRPCSSSAWCLTIPRSFRSEMNLDVITFFCKQHVQ